MKNRCINPFQKGRHKATNIKLRGVSHDLRLKLPILSKGSQICSSCIRFTTRFPSFFIKKCKWRLFGSKLHIFAHKRLYYTCKNSPIFQGYVLDRCPTKTYWWRQLLSNGRNLFVHLIDPNSLTQWEYHYPWTLAKLQSLLVESWNNFWRWWKLAIWQRKWFRFIGY